MRTAYSQRKVSSNDYRPVALTSVVMKCLERLVLQRLKVATDASLDPHQFAYRANRSVDDAVALGLHHIVEHLEKPGSYARVLFIDYSSAFNTIVPHKLFSKLTGMCVEESLCKWVLDFLLDRPQVVRVGSSTSSSITLNIGAPQGCVLSPLLFSLFTNDNVSHDPSVVILKFSDDTTLEGLISVGDESGYRAEVARVSGWCVANDLDLNVTKTKEMVFDRRKKKTPLLPLTISGENVEQVDSFKFLGVTISNDLSWAVHTDLSVKKAHQRLYFLRQLRKFKVSSSIMSQFYRAAVESLLTSSITVWYSSSCQFEKEKLEKVVRAASRIVGRDLPSIDSLHILRMMRKCRSIMQDPTHPAGHLFQPLLSGRRLRTLRCRTARLRNSFYPQAVLAFNNR
ncbi:hypothetical protein V1264_007114 [Littorina saxatilis]|uniref:Reverse transcriptase domain-containing protein n=1 Tax=Littorina saxatilis TaxID=31220 RepID=A0AAN9AVI2_9CAEN